MPLPKPKDDETKKDFLERCMGNSTMVDEYSDEDQRYAVCNSLWDQEKKSMERRFIQTELRVKEPENEGDMPKIAGYAAVFNKWSETLGWFREKIAPGAFTKALKSSDVRALWNHDPNYVLGRTSSGTLKLEERKKGLYMEVTPPDTQWAKDLLVSIGRKDVTQQSFAFTVGTEEWNEKKDGTTDRTILEVEQVFDVSPVTYPAYPDTSVALRSLEQWKEERQENNQEITENDDEIEEQEEKRIDITINLSKENIDEIVSRILTATQDTEETDVSEDIEEREEEIEERSDSPQDEDNPPDAEETLTTPFRNFFKQRKEV